MAAIASSHRMQMEGLAAKDGDAREGEGQVGAAVGGARAVAQWTAAEVLTWLAARGVDEGVIAAAETAQLDGAMMVEMTAAAWTELGVKAALDQMRLVACARSAAEEKRTDLSAEPLGYERLPI